MSSEFSLIGISMLITGKTIKYIDLFAGLGGFRLGLENIAKKHGISTTCVFSSEIKPAAIKAYTKNFKEEPSGDITAIKSEDIPDFDILLGGFPCQAFSVAGKRQGFADTRGTLFFEIERILKDKKPKAFILENVEGLITHDREDRNQKTGRTLDTILVSLKSMGYHVSWRLLDASEFGLAQRRKRVFIVGSLKEPIDLQGLKKEKVFLKDILQKNEKPMDSVLASLLLKNFKPEELYGKSIKDKRGGNTNIHSWDIGLKGECTLEQKQLLSTLLRVRRQKKWAELKGIHWMDGMPLTEQEISTFFVADNLLELLDDLVEKKYLRLEHPKDLVFSTNEQGKPIRSREYRLDLPKGYNIVAGKMSYEISEILNPNDVAPTLVAMDLDRIAVVDNSYLRNLTEVELKRLFGFSDDYDLGGLSQKEIYDLFGNTVPVKVVEKIVERLFFPVTNYDHKSFCSQFELF